MAEAALVADGPAYETRAECLRGGNAAGLEYALTTLELTEEPWTPTGICASGVTIPATLPAERGYGIHVSLFVSRGLKHRFAQVIDATCFQVVDPMTGTLARGDYAEKLMGVVRPKLDWSTSSGSPSASHAGRAEVGVA